MLESTQTIAPSTALQTFLSVSNRYTNLRRIGKLGFVIGTMSLAVSSFFNHSPTYSLTVTAISGFTWLYCNQITKDLESQAEVLLEHFRASRKEKNQALFKGESPSLFTPLLVPSLNHLNTWTATRQTMEGKLWKLIEMALIFDTNNYNTYKPLGSIRVLKLGKIIISTDTKQDKAILQYPRYCKDVEGGHGWKTFSLVCFGWKSLITATGDKHKKLIRTLGPLFTQTAVRNRYFDTLKSVTESTVSDWAKKKDGISLLNAALEHSCRSVTTCFLGQQAAKSKKIVDAVQNLMGVFWDAAQLKPKAILNQLCRKIFVRSLGDPDGYWQSHDVLEKAIKKTSKLAKNGELSSEDNFISRLLDEKFTMQELIDNMKMIYFAGTETNGSLITTFIGHVASNESEQEKLIEELKEAGIEKIEDLTFENLHSLKRFRAGLYESLRLVPPLPAQVRKVLTKFGNYSYFIDHYHRLRDCRLVGENPEKFNPDRILNNPQLMREIDLTFGGGLTPCLGKHFALTETLLLMVAFIQQGSFELIEGDPSKVIIEAGAHLSPNLKVRFKQHSKIDTNK